MTEERDVATRLKNNDSLCAESDGPDLEENVEEDDDSDKESDDDNDATFGSSVLGTKTYWDDSYSKELANFEEIGDEGTVWFGEDAIRRVVKWLEKRIGVGKTESQVLDLGCGNGAMLLALASKGWRYLTGVDYSQAAVRLAAEIARRKAKDGWLKELEVIEDQHPIEDPQQLVPLPSSGFLRFSVFDLTQESSNDNQVQGREVFDLILDKGTFDAISLCPDDASVKKKRYAKFVCNFLKPEGVFSITSCNWTEDELLREFGQDFVFEERIQFPSFQFGGKKGNTVTSLVFKKRMNE